MTLPVILTILDLRRSLVDINYFNQAQTVALTVFGIAGGVAMRLTRGYKNLLILGSAIRLLYARRLSCTYPLCPC